MLNQQPAGDLIGQRRTASPSDSSSRLLERLCSGSGHAELNVHSVWTLLLAHPALLSEHADLRSAAADTVPGLHQSAGLD